VVSHEGHDSANVPSTADIGVPYLFSNFLPLVTCHKFLNLFFVLIGKNWWPCLASRGTVDLRSVVYLLTDSAVQFYLL
jgi:hypothetical protein